MKQFLFLIMDWLIFSLGLALSMRSMIGKWPLLMHRSSAWKKGMILMHKITIRQALQLSSTPIILVIIIFSDQTS